MMIWHPVTSCLSGAEEARHRAHASTNSATDQNKSTSMMPCNVFPSIKDVAAGEFQFTSVGLSVSHRCGSDTGSTADTFWVNTSCCIDCEFTLRREFGYIQYWIHKYVKSIAKRTIFIQNPCLDFSESDVCRTLWWHTVFHKLRGYSTTWKVTFQDVISVCRFYMQMPAGKKAIRKFKKQK